MAKHEDNWFSEQINAVLKKKAVSAAKRSVEIFLTGYKTPASKDIKMALIGGFTECIIAAVGEPRNSNSDIQILLRVLEETVQDKSLIPVDFYARLGDAVHSKTIRLQEDAIAMILPEVGI